MAPWKIVAQRGDKRKHNDDSLFLSPQHFERYALQFKTTPIIQGRQVHLVDLQDSFIPSCFEGWGWDKLLCEFPRICAPLIRDFYANASLKEEHIECWVRGHAFTLDIDAILGLEEQNHEGFTPFKDRMLSLESVQLRLGGHREGKSLNKTSFPPNLRCLAYIMMFNLYPVKTLSTINNARAIFLVELHENTYIGCCPQR